MRFLPLPQGPFTAAVIVTVSVIAWIIWGSLKFPETLWAPGDLSRYHTDIQACSECHRPFRGATAEKCQTCHNAEYFANRAKPVTAEFHRDFLRIGKPCSGCHTEHRGTLAQITVGALENPHGEFVFRATGTRSCSACHDFDQDFKTNGRILDNAVVKLLMLRGKGVHRPGTMTYCLKCHRGGRLDTD